MGFRKHTAGQVPTKITVVGNLTEGRKWIGAAIGQLNLLENQMGFQSLEQGHRTVKLNDNIIVECIKMFHMAEVVIHAIFPTSKKTSEDAFGNCYCYCNTSVGTIVDINYNQDETDDWYFTLFTLDDTTVLVLPEKDTVYNVEVCQKTSFILYLNIQGYDHYPHEIGEKVLVIETDVLILDPEDEEAVVEDTYIGRSCSIPNVPAEPSPSESPWRLTSLFNQDDTQDV
jgi:hypothetical protein